MEYEKISRKTAKIIFKEYGSKYVFVENNNNYIELYYTNFITFEAAIKQARYSLRKKRLTYYIEHL